MKLQKTFFLMLIFIPLIFSGCFSSWQEETGTIILSLGSNSRSLWEFPPEDGDLDELEYEITFTGANDEFTLNSVGRKSVKATVASGEWKITVEAFTYVDNQNNWEKTIYATGKETVKVKPGQSNAVTVIMMSSKE